MAGPLRLPSGTHSAHNRIQRIRVLLRHAQERDVLAAPVGDQGGGPARGRGAHRGLLQPPAPPFDHRLPGPGRADGGLHGTGGAGLLGGRGGDADGRLEPTDCLSDILKQIRGPVPARGGLRREARGGRRRRPGRRRPRRARRPEARRGGQGVGGDTRAEGLGGDLRGGVRRLEARVHRKVDFGGYGGNPRETENGCPHNGPFCAGFEEGLQRGAGDACGLTARLIK